MKGEYKGHPINLDAIPREIQDRARILRFEAALDSKARSSALSWTEVAHEFGYYDQMHMVHDFEEFAGGTPTHMLKEVEELFRVQIGAIRSGRSLAARDDLEFMV